MQKEGSRAVELVKEKQENIIITGGAGFIGSNMAEHHIKRGDNVTVIDNLSTGFQKNLSHLEKNPHFTFIHSDVQTCVELPDLLKSSNRVYHLAATVGNEQVLKHPFSTLMNNTTACQKLLELAVENNPEIRVIVASSSEVYGFSLSEVLSEEDILCLSSPHEMRSEYAISKLLDESFSHVFHKKYNLPVTAVRLFNTAGVNQSAHYGMVVPRFIKQALSGDDLTVIGDGSHKRCFSDIRDIVIMLDELASNANASGKTINLGSDEEISIDDLANLIINLSNTDSSISYVNSSEVYGHEFRDITHRKPNLKLLYDYIDHQPKWKIKDTILQLIQTYQRK